ncbi:Rpn family recombination-promoting nuclease/putative transposase [Nocardioides carbamazepini]|uniref:Rpn family recombination-promoting nuclease/putative transposase n=1 Tax=Nocardioides carbamazepini TaxID=2854259 RepID=UPI002149FAA9|nr:Rpn family recombination-promoting nuclease/putative transposase [Nocardioides carbamazepini]MCR1786501.1 Rpn family recombination-promoting nuclease/putative transposase [Nocardioides carbamazepini]
MPSAEDESRGQPHDSLFRLVFDNAVNAASELRSLLAPAVLDRMDLDGLERVPGSFVDDDLRQRHADVLFRVPLDGREAYLYVLVEHQSAPDRLMALRMAAYQVRIWERHVKAHPGSGLLPLIVPVVVHSGRRRWNAATDLGELIDRSSASDGSADGLVPSWRYLLDDLAMVDDQALRQRPLTDQARLAFVAFRLPASEDAVARLAGWREDVRRALDEPGGRGFLHAWFTYVWATTDHPLESIVGFAETVGQQAMEVAMSTADVLEARGEARGKVGAVLSVLAARGIEVPDDVREQIASATDLDLLDTWLRRAVTAASAGEVVAH